MAMKIIAVTNQKGGVGKTATSLNLAMGLIRRGYRVLAIDLDPQQGNLSQTIGADKELYSMYEVLTEKDTLENAIQQTTIGLDIVSATIDMATIEDLLSRDGGVGREQKLKAALQAMPQGYDFVIIDTPPALNLLTTNALVAANYVVVVAEPDMNSMHGINQLNAMLVNIRKWYNKTVTYAGVLLTKVKKNTNIAKVMADLGAQLSAQNGTSLFNTTIRYSVAVPEAVMNQQDVMTFAKSRGEGKRCGAALDYEAFTDELLERIGGKG